MSDWVEKFLDRKLVDRPATPPMPLVFAPDGPLAPLKFRPADPGAGFTLLDTDERYVKGLRVLMLRVMVLEALVDRHREEGYVRFYLAERIGGSPADMGPGISNLVLVPAAQLARLFTRPEDAPVLTVLSRVLRSYRGRPRARKI